MSTELREIKNRIIGTRQIKRVAETLQRIAATQLIQNRRTLATSQRYLDRLQQLFRDAVAAAPDLQHPLLRPQTGRAVTAVIIFGPERGLCGGFHSRLAEALNHFMADRPADLWHVTVAGKAAIRRVRHTGAPIHEKYDDPYAKVLPRAPDNRLKYDLIDHLARTATQKFLEGPYHELYVIYGRFYSIFRQEIVVRRLLPIEKPAGPFAPSAAAFAPDTGSVVNMILPELLYQWLYDACVHSLASENASRQVAMSLASENAEKMVNELTLTYFRLRQESITTEMIELSRPAAG